MTTSTTPTIRPRTPTCLRHRVWMAACDDCRSAHAPAAPDGEQQAPDG